MGNVFGFWVRVSAFGLHCVPSDMLYSLSHDIYLAAMDILYILTQCASS